MGWCVGMLVLALWWFPMVVPAATQAVDALFPEEDPATEVADSQDAVAAEVEALQSVLQALEERLKVVESRLGSGRRLRPSPATSVERRLEDIERRLNLIEQQLRQWRTLEQRVRRLETQR